MDTTSTGLQNLPDPCLQAPCSTLGTLGRMFGDLTRSRSGTLGGIACNLFGTVHHLREFLASRLESFLGVGFRFLPIALHILTLDQILCLGCQLLAVVLQMLAEQARCSLRIFGGSEFLAQLLIREEIPRHRPAECADKKRKFFHK